MAAFEDIQLQDIKGILEKALEEVRKERANNIFFTNEDIEFANAINFINSKEFAKADEKYQKIYLILFTYKVLHEEPENATDWESSLRKNFKDKLVDEFDKKDNRPKLLLIKPAYEQIIQRDEPLPFTTSIYSLSQQIESAKKRGTNEALTQGGISLVGLSLGAAGVGAAIGTFVFPGLGTMIGAAIGALVGLVVGTAMLIHSVLKLRSSYARAVEQQETNKILFAAAYKCGFVEKTHVLQHPRLNLSYSTSIGQLSAAIIPASDKSQPSAQELDEGSGVGGQPVPSSPTQTPSKSSTETEVVTSQFYNPPRTDEPSSKPHP